MKSLNKFQILLIGLIVLLGIGYAIKIDLTQNISNTPEKKNHFLKTSYLYTVLNIEINNTNPSKNWDVIKATYDWCSGGPGTLPTNPYYIENVLFTPNPDHDAIRISNSDVYFRIKDCGIEGVRCTSIYRDYFAINFNNVSYGDILGCDLYDNDYGVNLDYSYNNSFSGNLIRETRHTNMHFYSCHDNIIFNNTITTSKENYGISIYGSNNLILENKITDNDWNGISLAGENNMLYKNTIENNGEVGINLNSCINNTVSENIVQGNLDGLYIGYGSINNHIISNIASNNLDAGIKLEGTANFNNITSNTFANNTIGIDLIDYISSKPANNKINLNNVSNNAMFGINLDNAEYNNITDNNLFNCGVYVYGSVDSLITNDVSDTNLVNGKKLYYYSDTDTLSNSDFTDAGQVILLKCNDSQASNLDLSFGTIGLSLIECNNIIMSDIESNNNTLYGIYLENCDLCKIEYTETNFNADGGIFIQNSVNCTLQSNTANNNSYASYYNDWAYDIGYGHGIYAHGPFNNTIKDNTASYNHEHGIYIPSGNNHEISNNTVEYNGDTGIYLTAHDTNVFSNTITGNHNNGLDIGGSHSIKIFQNTFQNHLGQGFIISHNGVFIYGGSENEVYNNLFLSYTRGVHLYTNSDNNNITNNEFRACIISIRISSQCNFNYLRFNIIAGTDFEGIELSGASNNTIESNHITTYANGIELTGSNFNLINNNTIDGRKYWGGIYGINLIDSSYNIISNNIIRDKSQCFSESGDCIGNIFENNDCQESSGPPFIPGYHIYLILGVLGIYVLSLLKKRAQIKIK